MSDFVYQFSINVSCLCRFAKKAAKQVMKAGVGFAALIVTAAALDQAYKNIKEDVVGTCITVLVECVGVYGQVLAVRWVKNKAHGHNSSSPPPSPPIPPRSDGPDLRNPASIAAEENLSVGESVYSLTESDGEDSDRHSGSSARVDKAEGELVPLGFRVNFNPPDFATADVILRYRIYERPSIRSSSH